MSKRGEWQLSDDAGGAARGGDEKRRAVVTDGTVSACLRLGDLVMCLIMSFLPRLSSASAAPVAMRNVVRGVCKRWRARRYDQWVDPRSAYMLALRAGNVAHANRLWTMRRKWIGVSSVDMVAAAAYGHVRPHLDRLCCEQVQRVGVVSLMQAALYGAARGGRVDVLQHVLTTFKQHFAGGRLREEDFLYHGLLDSNDPMRRHDIRSLRDAWTVAIWYGHIDMVRYLCQHPLGVPHKRYLLFRGVVLAALSQQSAVLELLWSVLPTNKTAERLLHDLYVFYKFSGLDAEDYVERFLQGLLPLSTAAQRQHLLSDFAATACRQPECAHGMCLILPTVTERTARSAALRQALLVNQASCGERRPLVGAYAKAVDMLKEHAYDNMRAAKILFDCAIAQNRADLVRYMLCHDKSSKLLQQCGVRALQSACQHGHLAVVHVLLDDGRVDPAASNISPRDRRSGTDTTKSKRRCAARACFDKRLRLPKTKW